jgi:hypothetical protein
MNGFMAKAVRTAWLAGGGVLAAGGCYGYYDIVDPCYPQRYNYAARQEVKQSFGPQIQNGHILDQTVWNYHFETGTANLTPGGMDYLAYVARRRPAPDPTIYLQVAQDIPYDPAAPDKTVEARNNLDAQRMKAITDFLSAQTAGRDVVFNVVRHDPGDVGMSAFAARRSIQIMQNTSQGIFVRPGGGGGGGIGGIGGIGGGGGSSGAQ